MLSSVHVQQLSTSYLNHAPHIQMTNIIVIFCVVVMPPLLTLWIGVLYPLIGLSSEIFVSKRVDCSFVITALTTGVISNIFFLLDASFCAHASPSTHPLFFSIFFCSQTSAFFFFSASLRNLLSSCLTFLLSLEAADEMSIIQTHK